MKKIINNIIWNIQRYKSPKLLKNIHNEDLLTVLEDTGNLDLFTNGNKRCICCGDQITKENLGGLIKRSGSPQFICDKDLCILHVIPSQSGDNRDV